MFLDVQKHITSPSFHTSRPYVSWLSSSRSSLRVRLLLSWTTNGLEDTAPSVGGNERKPSLSFGPVCHPFESHLFSLPGPTRSYPNLHQQYPFDLLSIDLHPVENSTQTSRIKQKRPTRTQHLSLLIFPFDLCYYISKLVSDCKLVL